MTLEELKLYRNIMYGLVALCVCAGAIFTYFATTYNNKIGTIQRDNQTDTLLSYSDKNTNSILDTFHKESDKTTKKIQNVLEEKKGATELSKKQLNIITEQENIALLKSKRLFEQQIQQLTDIFPTQDFENSNYQIHNYSSIKLKIQEITQNSFTFKDNEYKFYCSRIISSCDIMKAFFHNRSVGVKESICNNQKLSGSELDMCMYNQFRSQLVDFLNYSYKIQNNSNK